MLTRVATFAMNDEMLAGAMRTQAKLASAQLQEASGSVSGDFGGLGSQAGRYVSLQVSVTRSNAYEAAANEANGRTQAMSTSLSTLSDLISQFRSDLVGASGADGTSGLAATAQTLLQDAQATLNTQYEGRYLFAGSATTTAPVDVTALSATPSASTADTAYYKGNGAAASVRVSAEQTVSYGVTADNPAFEQLFRALNLVASGGSSVSSQTISQASSLTLAALDGVTGLQSQTGLASSTLQRAATAQSDYQSFAASQISDINDVDVAAVTAKVSDYTAQLQASYSALSKIQGLNLVDYLR